MVFDSDCPWLTAAAAISYLTQGELTPKGRRRHGRRWLIAQVSDGKLRAAKVGRDYLFRREWLDAFVEDHATPIMLPVRRRNG